jgi:hypothetical protein
MIYSSNVQSVMKYLCVHLSGLICSPISMDKARGIIYLYFLSRCIVSFTTDPTLQLQHTIGRVQKKELFHNCEPHVHSLVRPGHKYISYFSFY